MTTLQAPRVTVVPMTERRAQQWVSRIHRHHGPVPNGYAYFCLGAVCDAAVCGVAIVGRPTNRNSDDKQTAEVLRVATDGTRNACSALYGAAARAARHMGFAKIITYTLESEGGASLRGAGWVREEDGIQSWWHTNIQPGRTVKPREHYGEKKTRWGLSFREPVEYTDGLKDAPSPQMSLL